MTERFIHYLEREYARLERLIAEKSRCLRPDEVELALLKKQKLLVKDQIASWQADHLGAAAA